MGNLTIKQGFFSASKLETPPCWQVGSEPLLASGISQVEQLNNKLASNNLPHIGNKILTQSDCCLVELMCGHWNIQK